MKRKRKSRLVHKEREQAHGDGRPVPTSTRHYEDDYDPRCPRATQLAGEGACAHVERSRRT